MEVLEHPELGMEAVGRIEVEDFPAFVVVDDEGNDFFTGPADADAGPTPVTIGPRPVRPGLVPPPAAACRLSRPARSPLPVASGSWGTCGRTWI